MSRFVVLSGVFGFVVIVCYLQLVQTDYNPLYQLMSELALGKLGALMLLAFMSFAISVAAAIKLLPHPIIKFLSALAALSLASAGLFKLGEATTLHVVLVAAAFVLLVLCMYLTPRLIPEFQTPKSMAIFWGLGAATAIFVALGQDIMPIGLAQRLATTSILLWLFYLAI